jgi:hypothetical protein
MTDDDYDSDFDYDAWWTTIIPNDEATFHSPPNYSEIQTLKYLTVQQAKAGTLQALLGVEAGVCLLRDTFFHLILLLYLRIRATASAFSSHLNNNEANLEKCKLSPGRIHSSSFISITWLNSVKKSSFHWQN